MLAIERRNQILTMLQKDGRVLVSDLSTLFQVTEETIRRDLEKLEREGLAQKTYGGAIASDNINVDLPYTVRKKANVSNKQKIAEVIASLIEDGDHIMMDASSTAVYVAKHLKNKKKNITLITNSIEILLELSESGGWKVLSTGGTLKEGSLSLVGYQAEQMIKQYHVDKAVISCKGIDVERGITDSNEMEAHIKKLMLQGANTKILAADQSKFDKIAFTRICKLEDIDIVVTESELDNKWMQNLTSMNIENYYK